MFITGTPPPFSNRPKGLKDPSVGWRWRGVKGLEKECCRGQIWPIPHRSKVTCLTWALNFLHTVVIILKELSFYFWDLRKSGKQNFFAPDEHISKSVLIIWTQYCVPKINNVLNFLKLKIISFLQNGQNVVRSLISCFAEIAKFSPKFRFRLLQNFAEFEVNFAKHEIENSRKFLQITEHKNVRSHPMYI